MKYCKDCKYFTYRCTDISSFGAITYEETCTREAGNTVDLVTGIKEYNADDLLNARDERYRGKCGKEGIFFEENQ